MSYNGRNQIYAFPGCAKLETEEALRRWMLHNGVPNLLRLEADEQLLLTAWVRYTNVKRSDLCREVDNQTLDEKVASIFRTKLGIVSITAFSKTTDSHLEVRIV